MLGLIIAIIVLNMGAFLWVKRLAKSHIVHICVFIILFHLSVDLFLSVKYGAYWYFDRGLQWLDVLPVALLSPPAALLFLNGYPTQSSRFKRVLYILLWSLIITVFEALTMLPGPWGFFHHGWWKLTYSALVYPILFCIILLYYKWIRGIDEKESKGFDHFPKEPRK